jgi:hypothetical protein
MKNWKTTLIGILTAIGYTILDSFQKGSVDPKTILISAGFAILGGFSKDFNVTGGTK